MRLRPALRALGARWRHPALWLGAVGLPILQAVPLAFVPLSGPFVNLPVRSMLLATSLQWCLSVLLAALPFQWTGDDRPQTGFLRGFLQWSLMEVLTLAVVLPFLPWGLPPRQLGILTALVGAGSMVNLFLLLLLSWILVRGETEDAEVREAEARAQAAERLVARQTLSPRTIHSTLEALLAETDPARLENGLVDLAVLFRTRLMLQAQATVPFAQERALVEQLLQVLQRAGRLPALLNRTWSPEADGCSIPSLVVVQIVEILVDLLETCPVDQLSLSAHRVGDVLEVSIAWEGREGCDLLNRLECHPDLGALERRLADAALLREPLSLEREGSRARVRLRIPEVRP